MKLEEMSTEEILEYPAHETVIYNLDSSEEYTGAKIICGSPNGIINFNRTPHTWATTLFDSMRAREWSPDRIRMDADALNYKNLKPVEKRAYRLVLSQLITNDSIQTQQLAIGIDKYITSPVVNACLGRQTYEECVVPETMVLHKEKGWVKIEDIKEGDVIYACDENLIGKFTKVNNMTCYDFSGDMVKISGDDIEQIITPNHRILLIKDGKESMEVCSAEELLKSQGDIPNTVAINDENRVTMVSSILSHIITAWHEFVIAFHYEGTIVNIDENGSREVLLTFGDKDKIEHFKIILDVIDFQYSIEDNGDKVIYHVKLGADDKLYRSFKDNMDLSEFNRDQASSFISGLWYWNTEGHGKSKDGYRFENYDDALFVTSVASLAEYKVKLTEHEDGDRKFYRVKIDENSNFTLKDAYTTTTYPYTGKVYCPTVDGGFFLCMLNGKVSITGNSVHSRSYTVMAEDACNDTDALYSLHEVYPELMKKNLAVGDMYARIYRGRVNDVVRIKDVLLAFVANQILEELVFPGGFATMYTLEEKMRGTVEMIVEIKRMGLPAEQSVA